MQANKETITFYDALGVASPSTRAVYVCSAPGSDDDGGNGNVDGDGGGGGSSIALIVGVTLVLLMVLGAAAVCYVAKKKTNNRKSGLNDPLIENDSLEMGVLASQPSPGPAPATVHERKGSVRKMDARGPKYPCPRVAASEAESYGVISTATVVDIIPRDSEADRGATANAGGLLVAAAAVGAPTVCNVLVAGEIRANVASIQQALEQAESDIRENYTKDNNVKMEVTLSHMSPSEMADPDQHLPKKLSQYHVIIMAFSARPVYLPIVGVGGKLEKLLEKLLMFGVPEMSLYFIATDDRDAKDVGDNFEGGNQHSTIGLSSSTTTLGPGTMSEDEVVSEGLKARLGPMQLAHLQSFFAAARFLSWDASPASAQRKLLRRHLRYLAHHKPKRRIDSNKFRCAQCEHDFSLVEVKDMLAAGSNAQVKALCASCCKGYCASCGESWGTHEVCVGCGADLSSELFMLDSLLQPAERQSEARLRKARLQAASEGKMASASKAAALARGQGSAVTWGADVMG
jgi:hypothetical protein